jgi:hypothetical protein
VSPIETRLVIATVLALAAILLVAIHRGRLGTAADTRAPKTTVLALGLTTAFLVVPAAIVLAIRAL